MKRLLPILVIFGLLMSSGVSTVFAQDDPVPNNGQAGSTIFLPVITQAGRDREQAVAPTGQQPTLEDAASIAVEKGVGAAARGLSQESLQPVSVIVTFDESVSAEQVAGISGGQIIHRYDKILNGISMIVDENKVPAVASMPGVTGVYLDELNELNTDVSPAWIGAPTTWTALGGQESAGEGVIVGVIDSGIWPEHPSVSDPDPSGKPYAAPPAKWTGTGCDFGTDEFNPTDAPFTCNNKLIGAYDFTGTYAQIIGLLPTEFASARDSNGHGTHTLTTSAGNAGVEASIYGRSFGIVSGIAPRAHVVAYKACGADGCFNSDTLAAINQAVADGVDVVNYSISGGGDPFGDVVSLGFLDAYDAGVLVVPSAGNSGPGADTVSHREPWTLTVGASTSNRHLLTDVTLVADNGESLTLTGATVTDGIDTATPVVFPPSGEEACLNPLPAGTFNGEIVVCERGVIARVMKSYNVFVGGAGGMLLYNPTLQGLNTDNHFIPSVHLENDAGAALLDFMGSHSGVTATFADGAARTVQGDVMAPFSSRGGPGQTLGISKPDVTAPGVQILAGNTPLPERPDSGEPGQLFQSIQGTSMSAPHATGAAALIKALHPDWAPGQIKSALMLTAKTDGVTKEDSATPADAFDYGSGRIDLNVAGFTSVTMDESGEHYLTLAQELWNANYPSLYVPVMPGELTVQRTFHNVTREDVKYAVSVDSPADLLVQVGEAKEGKFKTKEKVEIKKSGDGTFAIHIDARFVPLGETRHATIHFTNKENGERLSFPVTIVRNQPVVTLNQSCDPTILAKKGTTTCTITIQNTSFSKAKVSLTDRLPEGLNLDPKSVTGGSAKDQTVTFSGSLYGAAPPIVNVAVDPLASPFGYVPLALFGIAPIGGVTDESISNFNVASFTYAGENFNRIGVVSNGYLVVGGGTGADINYINSDLPNPALPNNVLAPFWTDLNPSAGGAIRLGYLGIATNTWLVVDYENVPNYSGDAKNSFQVWIGVDGVEDISFVYGPDISGGDGGFLTVGAENKYGNEGGTVYFDGTGTPPAPSFPNGDYEVDVFSTPGAPGETRVITYQARGEKPGPWVNCAEMTSDLYQGVNISCVSGEVTR